MEATRETRLLTARVCEDLKKQRRDLWDLFREETIIVDSIEVPWFVAVNGEHRISFYVHNRTLACDFLDYPRYWDLFPHPEEAIDEFVKMLGEVVSEQKSILLWQSDELVPLGELIESEEKDFYSFLWESAEKAWIVSWNGTKDEELKAAQPGATDNPDDAQRLREDH